MVVITLVALVACAAPKEPTAVITGRLVAGPVCPVETNPPDPACAPRPVAGAEIVAMGAGGDEYRTTSGAEGRFNLPVPAGDYTVTFAPAEGMMGTPEPVTVSVEESATLDVGDIGYDTGIR